MNLNELFSPITPADLRNLELGLDILFSKLDIDIDLSSRHFLDRINDIRNNPPIDIKELYKIFKKVFLEYGEAIKSLDDKDQGVLKDIATKLNIPFIVNYDARKDMEIVKAKTIMRKPNFTTPDKTFPVNTDESLNELRTVDKTDFGSKWRIEASRVLANHGFNHVGEGAFAQVFIKDDYPWAIKIFTSGDRAYMNWLKFCQRHQDNPYIPKIKGAPIKITNFVSGIRIEKLIECSMFETKEFRNDIFKACDNRFDDPKYGEHLNHIIEFLKWSEHLIDLHVGNVMKRADGQFVITDPLS